MSFCIFNSRDKLYKSPFGAVKTNEKVTFNIALAKTTSAHSPLLLVYKADEWGSPQSIPMTLLKIDTACNYYTVQFSADTAQLYFYCFSVTMGGSEVFIKKGYDNCGVLGLNDGQLWQLTVYDQSFTTPDFIKGGIIYQIFPDRFCKSDTPKQNVPSGRFLRGDWGGMPVFRPNEQGKITNNDYFCGDLNGITQKLGYLKSLGVTVIYLNPIFEAHSNHRYNTADYSKIDPLLGDEEDFKNLCKQAKDQGISIVLDGVFSHTGSDSIYFNKDKRYGENTGAYNSQNSPYYSWYTFENYPDKYQCWWGFATLPNTNETDPVFSDYICGENGIINKWIKLGAKGFRLDVADELPDEFIKKIRTAVKQADENAVLIGEVWEDASNKQSYGIRRQYLLGSQLDSVMNYPFKNAVLSYIKGGNGEAFLESILTVLENYPKPVINSLMNSLSTHDTERAITILGGEPAGYNDREWQAAHHNLNAEQYRTGKHRLMLASVIQFFLPGTPCIYYGDEAGMCGYKDPFNRCCYLWGSEDTGILDFIRFIAKIRIENSFLSAAEFIPVTFSDNICSFIRKSVDCDNKAVFIAVNRDISHHELIVPPDFFDKQPECVLGEYKNAILSPMSAVIIKQ